MWTYLEPVILGFYCLAALGLHVYGINCYVMILLFKRRSQTRIAEERALLRRFSETSNESSLPVVTTQLPIYNEQNVIERLLKAVCAFDYPEGKHEIQVLDDSTDETSEIVARLVETLKKEGHDIQHVIRTHREGFKAGALAEGLLRCRGELVAVFDADFVPPPEFLRNTVPFLVEDPRCGFVQTRWGHRNRDFSTLTRAQSIGIDGHFVVEQSARSWNGLFFNFNGTAGVWRRKAIDEAGGWQPDTLTEDLDLSYRTQLAGWTARYLLDVVTPAEIPTNINAFKSQQRRWAKGSIQTARKILPKIYQRKDIPLFKKAEATLHLTHYLIHPMILTMTLLLPAVLFRRASLSPALAGTLAVAMCISLFAPSTLYMFAQRTLHRKWSPSLACLPALMGIGVGLAVNNSRAVVQAFLGRGGEFVRTPKLGTVVEGSTPSASKIYRLPVSRLFLAEIVVGAWALAALIRVLSGVAPILSPVLFLHAVGFTYVGVASLLHDRKARRQEV